MKPPCKKDISTFRPSDFQTNFKHMKQKLFLVIILMTILLSGCRERPVPNINIEQKEHKVASKIIAPGMGTIGLIENGTLTVYYIDENRKWHPDSLSKFDIPAGNQGLLALGAGTIGVVMKSGIHIYRLDNHNNWATDPRHDFPVPKRYDRMMAAKMPWEMGMILIENDSYIDFYYFDEENGWLFDETATFRIPSGIRKCMSLGDMTIAITDEMKLGIYYLHPEGEWQFADDIVLQLPENYEAIIPWETGFIAVLMGNTLEFYKLDLQEGTWLHIEDMAFILNH
jgi:hypothetical protein